MLLHWARLLKDASVLFNKKWAMITPPCHFLVMWQRGSNEVASKRSFFFKNGYEQRLQKYFSPPPSISISRFRLTVSQLCVCRLLFMPHFHLGPFCLIVCLPFVVLIPNYVSFLVFCLCLLLLSLCYMIMSPFLLFASAF